jgi:surface antigen
MKLKMLPAIVALILGTPCWAFNTQFLGKSPYARFSPQDKQALTDHVVKALRSSEDGQTTEWENRSSGASGAVTPQRTFEAKGSKCREVVIESRYKAQRSQGTYTICQDPRSKWKPAS